MVFKSLIGTVCACLIVVSINANAELISVGWNDDGDNLITRDTETGLDWLDLSVTAGETYSKGETLYPGWRFATSSEIGNIFEILFQGYYPNNTSLYTSSNYPTYPDQLSDIFVFQAIFGITATSGERNYTHCFYKDEAGVIRLIGAYADPAGLSHAVFGPGYLGSYDGTHTTVGIYLVRTTSVVPIPSAVWLFSSGLLGLIGFTRRKAWR